MQSELKKYDFTNALIKNIERTYTFSHVVNMGFLVSINDFDSVSFFLDYVSNQPFDAFMGLEAYGFKRAKRDLDKYGFEYTEEQERVAKVFYDVTETMNWIKSDVVPIDTIEAQDLSNTKVIKIKGGLTTEDTWRVHEKLDELPRNRKTGNVVYEEKLPSSLKQCTEQKEAIENCVTNHISVLIGGAGTGKSFVTANIVDQLMLNGKNVVILAPTHKAKDALQQKLTKGEVKTIHSYVHSKQMGKEDAIVIDEAGMVSTPLLNSLFKRYRNQQLVFVGDKNQLEPVGYGRPFEKIMSIFPTYELKQNHRSESRDIIALGREVIGEPFNANMEIENIHFAKNVEEAFDMGAEVVLTYKNDDVKAINQQQKIKDGKKTVSPDYSIGDKVIAKTNRKGYYNGQLFDIVDYNTLRTPDGRKEVLVQRAKDLEYNFDFAYGLTIHKSQGSEWDCVGYMPSERDTRNLAYVAMTRAKKKLIIIGELKTHYIEEREWQQLS